jgi:hypothetical protein
MWKIVWMGLLLVSAPALAQTVYKLKEGWPACATKDAMDEMSRAINAQDAKWMQAVQGCIFLKAGVTGTMDDYSLLTGVSRLWLRAPGGDRPVRMYVNNKSFQ